jgi:hypothetical protein
MWKIKGTAVVWDEPKTADRPHNLTLLIGLFSPLVAVVALTISLSSLNTSERSLALAEKNMKIAQRGYVRLTGGTITVSQPLALLAMIGQPPPPSADELIGFGFAASLENLGNTPVRFTRFSMELPAAAGITFDRRELQRHLPPELGQRVKYDWSWSAQGVGNAGVVRDLKKDFAQLRTIAPSFTRVILGSPVNFNFTLAYKDVFQEEHVVRWCWTPLFDRRTATMYGEKCDY